MNRIIIFWQKWNFQEYGKGFLTDGTIAPSSGDYFKKRCEGLAGEAMEIKRKRFYCRFSAKAGWILSGPLITWHKYTIVLDATITHTHTQTSSNWPDGIMQLLHILWLHNMMQIFTIIRCKVQFLMNLMANRIEADNSEIIIMRHFNPERINNP